MAIKMIVRRVGVAAVGLVVASACNRSYVAAGANGEFDLSGSYVASALPVANGCPNLSGAPVESRLDVQHARGELRLTVVFEGDPYPTQVQRNGKFASSTIQRSRSGAVEYVTMRGRFRDSSISASLDVKRSAVRTVLPTSRPYTEPACTYHVNLSGKRISEAQR